ncbi:galactose ABC transporter substrate-binding protein [Alloiococcus sp. CFN-8]|uniref:galactose ABC transporter substrate-binding protein n=1 Tax=Alloiococcus sp. CFN-8 TaxID=3416081 RepID=UPI003CECDFFD
MKGLKIFSVLSGFIILVVAIYYGYIREGEESPEKNKVIKIGVALYSEEDVFISNIMAGMWTKAKELEDSTGIQSYINIADSKEDQFVQNDQIERFIALNYDVLCVNLVDRTNAAHIIDMARDADIPLVFFNREPVQEDMERWEKVYYVGTDARKSAELQADMIIYSYKDNPGRIDINGDGIIQYIMLEGESRHQDTLIRTEVSIKALKDAGLEVEKVDGAIANWDRSQAKTLVERIFKKHKDEIELIISNNDDMALGAVQALEELGISFSNIVGIDGTVQGLEAVQEKKS